MNVETKRINRADQFMVRLTNDLGFHRWMRVDLSGPSMVIIEQGEGDPPESELPPGVTFPPLELV